MEDQTIICADCREKFIWDVEEQAFFREKGFAVPKRCLTCRHKRREQRQLERAKETIEGGA